MCIAKSSTSNRREQIASRELMLQQLAVAPKGRRKLAGGASHRFIATLNPSPSRGGGRSTGSGPERSRREMAQRGFRRPSRARRVCVRNRWLAPPANFRDASGVHCPTSPNNLAHSRFLPARAAAEALWLAGGSEAATGASFWPGALAWRDAGRTPQRARPASP
jgi:hypothetical protein